MDIPSGGQASAPLTVIERLREVGRTVWSAMGGSAAGAKAGKPSVRLQVGYGLGSAASGIAGLSLSSALLLLYFNQVVGLPAVWVGAAIMVTITVDAFTDPLIGWFSDRLRSPLGRRHTLMYLAAVPAALGFFLMWQAPNELSPGLLIAFMIAMLIFVNISISLFEIPATALAPELAPDYDSRSNLIAYRWLFRVIGSATMNMALYGIFLRQDASNPLGTLNRDRYEDFGLVSALVIFVVILASTAATHHRIKDLHAPKPRPVSLRSEWPLLKTALSHKPLIMIMLGGVMMGFGAGTTQGLYNYMYLHFWGVKSQDMTYLVAAGLVASFLALFLGPLIGARFGKKRAIIGLYALWLCTAVGPIALRFLGAMPENGSPLLIPILATNAGLGLTLALCCHIMLGSCIADSIDDISVKTGVRTEGLLFGGYSVLDKIAIGGGALMAGTIISAIAFPTKALPGTVAPEILSNMALALLAIIFVFNLISIAFLSRYNLTREDHERNAAILAARHARARAEMEDVPGAAVSAPTLTS